jgi:hypothetical protein
MMKKPATFAEATEREETKSAAMGAWQLQLDTILEVKFLASWSANLTFKSQDDDRLCM